MNILTSLEVYLFTDTHPYNLQYFKLIISSILAAGLVYVPGLYLIPNISILNAIFLTLAFGFTYLLILLIFRSYDQEDIMIILELEKKLGLDLKFLKQGIKKFI